MNRPRFITNNIYNVYNRGTDKRNIFLDDSDRIQFIHDIFEFNDKKAAPHLNIRLNPRQIGEVGLPLIARGAREMLVEILAFILMPNHYHLLLRQIRDGGITTFMRKLGTGYTNSFNLKYERSGVLFQGKFKAVPIEREQHFIYMPYYIHFNCLDLVEPGWREGRIESFPKAMRQLEKYRWSSHLDYTGKKNFPSVTQREWLLQVLGGEVQYKKGIVKWLKQMKIENIEKSGIKQLLLE